MPRSKVRPNVSTYHEAIFMVLESDGSFPGLPLTKNEDKFTAKGVTYLAGRFNLPITAKIQDVYQEVASVYGLPDNFLTMVRAMQQTSQGVEIPASYGTLHDNALAVTQITDRIRASVLGYDDDDFVTDEEVYGEFAEEDEDDQQPTEGGTPHDDPEAAAFDEAARQKRYDELAAANPLAAAFARMIMASPDIEEDDDDWGNGGTWDYPGSPPTDEDEYSEE